MIISFAHTTPALLAGKKSVTRRMWVPTHAARFTPGLLVDAWDKSPRIHGRRVATIQITTLTWEPLAAMPDSDYAAEGFAYLAEFYAHWPIDYSRAGFERWRQSGGGMWVVRFNLVHVFAQPEEYIQQVDDLGRLIELEARP